MCLGLVVPRTLFAAPNLALPRSDYPNKSQVAVLPATNHVANRYFGPVHRSSFGALHRIDGAGWLQAAVWRFTTGKGGARRTHQTIFAYAINVYPSKKDARAAVSNVKIKTRPYRVSKIYSRLYQHTDGRETLDFLFFSYHSIEVESYYEYTGTAPAGIARSLHALFLKQGRHLAAMARKLHNSITSPPPPPDTATPVPTDTATPPPTDTPTPIATSVPATPTATAVPPTATPYPSPTPTNTPIPVLTLTAEAGSQTYAPNTQATVNVKVTLGTSPVAGAQVSMTFEFPGSPAFCNTVTDDSGNASCSAVIPAATPANTTITVYITVRTPSGGEVNGTATFKVT